MAPDSRDTSSHYILLSKYFPPFWTDKRDTRGPALEHECTLSHVRCQDQGSGVPLGFTLVVPRYLSHPEQRLSSCRVEEDPEPNAVALFSSELGHLPENHITVIRLDGDLECGFCFCFSLCAQQSLNKSDFQHHVTFD